jgi:DNA-binding NarL/FixJ family response regulator
VKERVERPATRPASDAASAWVLRCAVVGAPPLLCDLLAGYLRTSSDSQYDVVLTATDPGDVLAHLTDLDVDVFIVDLDSRAGTSPLVFLNRLRALRTPVGIVGLIGDQLDMTELQTTPGLMGANVVLISAYAANPQTLVLAVEHAARHGGDDLASALAAARATRGRRTIGQLPERKRQILVLLAAGLSNHGIADALGISVRSVESHLTALYTQLGIETADTSQHSRVAAIRQYYGLG